MEDQDAFTEALSKDIQDGNPVVSKTGSYGNPAQNKNDSRSEFVPDDRTGAPVPVDAGKGQSALVMH
jgi:hypothetical protein